MITRRTFIRTVTAAGGVLALRPGATYARTRRASTAGFGIHPFIEDRPDAVFIMRTDVDVKTNAPAKLQAGLALGRSVFLSRDTEAGGVPLTYNVAVKPNLVCRRRTDPRYTIEGTMGIVTDCYFVEGMIESLKELGLSGSQFYIREVSCPADFADSGYVEMAARTGAELRDLSAPVGVISETDLHWTDVPEGIWFRRIPHLWPINAPGSWLLNIAKLKAHAMGMTLCAKNLQGGIAHNYQAHCTAYGQPMDVSPGDLNPGAEAEIAANYTRHVAMGIPRWDKPGSDGGIWQETWATRCLDNNSVTNCGLHVIEGIYGRDGHFIDGPSPQGLATDYMTNVVIFGMNPFYVDNVGHWLAGHEPANFGLFHLAVERGLAAHLCPAWIPVYEWHADGTASLSSLQNFARTPLKTYYLQRNYNGQTEQTWHLVDEPNESCSPSDIESAERLPFRPTLERIFPNPFRGLVSIQFTTPVDGSVKVDVCNVLGEVVDILVDGPRSGGRHLVVWNSGKLPAGVYFCRLRGDGAINALKMVLVD